ncbi:hypothetical protein IAD21_02014 [Abditibacteriota bacterium]|nr:hypothetical protein IAD21_02014 [Abditibacteriota bacterium]
MKLTKQCSECGGREIYTTGTYRISPSNILLPRITNFTKQPRVEIYVCGNCGFHQMFIEQETLQKVKEKYKRYE